jgi:hypothetical protein
MLTDYDMPLWRTSSEAHSFILQATLGCIQPLQLLLDVPDQGFRCPAIGSCPARSAG